MQAGLSNGYTISTAIPDVFALIALFLRCYSLGELIAYRGNILGPVDEWQTFCHYTRADLPMQQPPADHPAANQTLDSLIDKN